MHHALNCRNRRATEDRINSFPHFTTDVNGVNIHFVGLFSLKKDAVPVLLIHGWPGRFYSSHGTRVILDSED